MPVMRPTRWLLARRFAVERGGDGMDHRGDAHRGLHLLRGDAVLAHAPSRGESMHMPQPLIAETASDHSSKSTFSTPGLAITFMRSCAGRVL